MNSKMTMAIIATIVMMSLLFVPMSADGSDAEITVGDISVVVPGHSVTKDVSGDTINLMVDGLKVSNNRSTEIPVYITNNSASAMNISATGTTGKDLSVSSVPDKNVIFRRSELREIHLPPDDHHLRNGVRQESDRFCRCPGVDHGRFRRFRNQYRHSHGHRC